MLKLVPAILILFWLFDRFYRSSRKQVSHSLPPGPYRLPIIGNWLDLPKHCHHHGRFWATHKAKYGPISSVAAFGQTVIIVNDIRIASELLDKKSLIYSDRYVPVFGAKLCGIDENIVFLPYGERFRATRKLFHQFMGNRSLIARYEPLEDLEARRLLLEILRDPQNFRTHIRMMTGANILKLAYGYEIRRDGTDPLIEAVELALRRFSASIQPGAWLVDALPALQYLPMWIPGTAFRRTAEEWKVHYLSRVQVPYAFVKRQMAEGIYFPSFTSKHLESGPLSSYEEDIIMWAAGDLYSGGTDTTVSVIASFILAMVLYPQVMRRAQQEIDTVIGRDRLPGFADRASLPYICAIVSEALRWNVVTPTGIPHVSSQDDTHGEHIIPKGSIVVPNIWQFSRHPDVYNEPWAFKPERFLELDAHKPETDPRSFAFGFGRRVCPGKDLAESTIYITIAMCLAVFDFGKAVDNLGNVIEPLYEYTNGSISHPKEFSCSITPRDTKAALLIGTVTDGHLPFAASEL